MFLTIGEKVKRVRVRSGLKQSAFECYGISQHYLSLIENNRRQPSAKMKQKIYTAFCELTQDQPHLSELLIDLLKDPQDEAREWIAKRLALTGQYDETLLQVAKTSGLTDVLFRGNWQLGEAAASQQKYSRAIAYFEEALVYADEEGEPKSQLYRAIARCLKHDFNEAGAKAYYQLALTHLHPSEDKYSLWLELAEVEASLQNWKKALTYIEESETSSQRHIQVQCLLLKEQIWRQQGQAQKGRKLLDAYLSEPLGEALLDQVFYHLALNEASEQRYHNALKRCLYLLNGETPVTDEIRIKTLLLMASLYETLEEYETGLRIIKGIPYEGVKEIGPRVLKDYYESYLQLLTQLNEREEISRLLLEVNRLVEKEEIHEGILHHLLTYTMKTRLKTKKIKTSLTDCP